MKKITEIEFANQVIQMDGLQIVHFYNPYSNHSNETDSILDDLYKTNTDDVQFFKINLLQCEVLCDRYGISLPCVLIFDNGVLQDLVQDVVSREYLEYKISALLANS